MTAPGAGPTLRRIASPERISRSGLAAAELDVADLPVDALPVYWCCLAQENWRRAYGASRGSASFRRLLDRVLFESYPSVKRFLVRRGTAAIGFFHLDFKSEAEAEISGGLVPAWNRRGLGAASAALALAHAFGPTRLKAVMARVDRSNRESRRVLERLGFVRQESRQVNQANGLRDRFLLEGGAFPNPFALALLHRRPSAGESLRCC